MALTLNCTGKLATPEMVAAGAINPPSDIQADLLKHLSPQPAGTSGAFVFWGATPSAANVDSAVAAIKSAIDTWAGYHSGTTLVILIEPKSLIAHDLATSLKAGGYTVHVPHFGTANGAAPAGGGSPNPLVFLGSVAI